MMKVSILDALAILNTAALLIDALESMGQPDFIIILWPED